MNVIHGRLKQHEKLLADDLDDFALVDDGVERVTHLVRNGGVNKTKQFTFSSGAIIEDFLRNIDKANHGLFVFSALDFDHTFLYLEEFELRDIFVVYAFHAW